MPTQALAMILEIDARHLIFLTGFRDFANGSRCIVIPLPRMSSHRFRFLESLHFVQGCICRNCQNSRMLISALKGFIRIFPTWELPALSISTRTISVATPTMDKSLAMQSAARDEA